MRCGAAVVVMWLIGASCAMGAADAEVQSLAERLGGAADGLVQITEDSYAEVVRDRADPLFVVFYASWCQHCKNMQPKFRRIARALKVDNVAVGLIDADENPWLVEQYAVQGYPTYLFIAEPRHAPTVTEEYIGQHSVRPVVAFVRKHLNKQQRR